MTRAGNPSLRWQSDPLPRRRVPDPTRAHPPARPVSDVSSRGTPLDASTRELVEPHLGHDFSRVRVHAGTHAAASAAALGARAYTSGNDIVFNAGEYSPHTPKGQQLLVHELVHVVQHRVAPVPENAPLTSRIEHPAERQADTLTRRPRAWAAPEAWQPVAPRARLSLAPEPWYRGEVAGVPAAPDVSAGRGVVHDLGPGKYFSDSAEVAQMYSEIRDPANPAAARRVIGGNIDPAQLGKVLDLTKDPDFMRTFEMVKKARGALGVTGEEYRKLFNHYLQRKGLKVESFQIIIGPEGLRGGKQMCVRDPAVLKQVMASMTPVKPGGAGPGPAGGAAPAKPGPQAPPQGAPTAPSAKPGRGTRIAIGAAKFFGPLILQAINQYFMGKEEAERANQLIAQVLASPEISARISDLIEKDRVNVARKQYRGMNVYGTVDLKLTFINDVMEKFSVQRIRLGNVDDNSIMSTVMSHGAIVGEETKVWYVTASGLVPPVPLTKSEDLRLRIEILDEQAATTSMDPQATAEMSEERYRLFAALRRAEEEEKKEKQAEIGRPAVIADPKARAQQQAEISEQLRRLEQKKPIPPKKEERPREQAPAAPLVPQPAPAQQPLLPGAPGEGPIEQAERVVRSAAAWSEKLKRRGAVLENRLGSNDPPSPKERQAFFDAELSWRLAIKYAMNTLENRSRSEAVNALAELLDRYGPQLHQYRVHLGG